MHNHVSRVYFVDETCKTCNAKVRAPQLVDGEYFTYVEEIITTTRPRSRTEQKSSRISKRVGMTIRLACLIEDLLC